MSEEKEGIGCYVIALIIGALIGIGLIIYFIRLLPTWLLIVAGIVIVVGWIAYFIMLKNSKKW